MKDITIVCKKTHKDYEKKMCRVALKPRAAKRKQCKLYTKTSNNNKVSIKMPKTAYLLQFTTTFPVHKKGEHAREILLS